MNKKWILETLRLALRELEQSDFDDLFAMFNDALVMKYYPSTRSPEETQRWIDGMKDSYERHGHRLWAVELKSDRTFVGQCGLLLQNVDGWPEIEVGYLLKSAHWHHGYATEAAIACRDYAFSALGCSSVISLIRPINLHSRAVAERNGMLVEKAIMHRNLEALVYRVWRKT